MWQECQAKLTVAYSLSRAHSEVVGQILMVVGFHAWCRQAGLHSDLELGFRHVAWGKDSEIPNMGITV